ncbi:DUF3800 domain-containing protein [uncultured Brachyspira sp.]|uniref:DUF3800 domain-containing protein n=1 Tax=uncultured Brachyspira sp. TaxID=221953 RepID=UPI0026254136|nr:DUF3800 domain-containing protein [uncultured Brachyspira sp.]
MNNIYFDEAGNTGFQLLNEEQPIYILSGNTLEETESKNILEKYFSDIEKLHFVKLKKNSKGKKELINFIKKEMNSLNSYFYTSIIHKEFFLLIQILDHIIEPQMYRDGIDYYDRGFHIAFSNIMFFSLPVVCDKNILHNMYMKYLKMIRIKDEKTIKNFEEELYKLIDTCKNDDIKRFIQILTMYEDLNEYVNSESTNSLDPSMHALVSICLYLNEKYNDGFTVCHDQSNMIYNQEDKLLFLSNKKIPNVKIGYGKFKSILPLKILNVKFLNSEESYSIKLCDIISGILFSYVRNILNEKFDNELFNDEIKSICKEWKYTHMVYPSIENVKPIEDMKKENGDINLLDFFAENDFGMRFKI